MAEPYPQSIQDSHRLIRERSGFATMADFRAHIDAQSSIIDAQAKEIGLLATELIALQAKIHSQNEVITRIAAAVDVLNSCLLAIDKSEPYPSRNHFLAGQICAVISMLGGGIETSRILEDLSFSNHENIAQAVSVSLAILESWNQGKSTL